MTIPEDRQAAVDLWIAHQALCNRLADHARADGWEVPPGPVRVVKAGLPGPGLGLYTVVVGEHFSPPIRCDVPEVEGLLYDALRALMTIAGVPYRGRQDRQEETTDD